MAEHNAGSAEKETGAKGLNDMTRGRPWRHILIFSLPILASNVLQQLYNIIDAVVVGQKMGQTGLVGVGNTGPVILMITSLFVGIGLGAAVLLSQYFGAGDLESLRSLVATVYSLLLPLIAVITLIALPLTGPLMNLIQVPEEAVAISQIYMTIIILGFLGSFGFNLNAGILMAMGNSILPFIILCVTIGANTVLAILFVVVFNWGAAGAAVATVIAQFGSWIFGMLYINKRYPFLSLSLFRFEYHWELLKKAASLGIASGVYQTLIAAGTVAMLWLVNAQAKTQGLEFSTGFQAAIKIDTFAMTPIQSVASAVTTFVAQNMGVGRIDRVKQGLKTGLLLSVAFSALIIALVWPLGPFLLGLFFHDENPQVVETVIRYGLDYLHIVMPFYVMMAAMLMFHAVLRGAGQMMIPMIATLAGLWLVRIPAANLLTANVGAENMYYAIALDWTFGFLVAGAYYLTGRWRKKRLIGAVDTIVLS